MAALVAKQVRLAVACRVCGKPAAFRWVLRAQPYSEGQWYRAYWCEACHEATVRPIND